MSKIFIKPAAGLKVRHVEKLAYFIAEDGEWVEDNLTWQRRINDGDVVLAEPPKVKKEVKEPVSNKEGEK